ncbi:Protein RIC-7 b [Aphelenchoides avenae]|nr:Protein RIC-7 b [Aphelenchus avenae]
MSLLPSCSTAAAFGGIPVLFLEARVQCNPGEVITQMGLSLNADNVDVSMLTRTSGVLLVAGFGSYCAYRMCRRYLGKDFVWTMLDAARCDLLARADSRLLHPAGEGYYDAHGNQEFRHQLLRDILNTTVPVSQAPSLSDSVQRCRTAAEYTVVSSNGKVVRVIRGDPLKRRLHSPDTQQGFATLPSPDSTSSPTLFVDEAAMR